MRMGKMTYTKLINSALKVFSEEGPLEAYAYISENSIGIKVNEAQIYNFRYCFACLSGQYDLGMHLMKEAIADKGYWYSYEYLLEDDDLEPLRQNPDFSKLANLCKARELEAKENTKPDMKYVLANNIDENKEKQLLIALHGNEENISLTEDYWSSWVMDNKVLAMPQSSQIGFSDGFYWEDTERGAKEIAEQYNKALLETKANKDNVIIGGFSAGTGVILDAILKDNIKVKGFIFVAPWLPELEKVQELIETMKAKAIKGYIICGDKDEDCLEGAQKFVELLNKSSVPNIYKIVKGLDHDYPENFEECLNEAIEFIG